MKYSKFNKTYNFDDRICIYNSRTGKVLKIQKEEIAKNILEVKSVTENIEDTLLKNGFWVRDTDNEEDIWQLEYSEMAMDNTLQLVLLPTEMCNFRCRYCYGRFPKTIMSTQVQEGIINYLKKNINQYKALNISWFGGEPLLFPNIITELSRQMIELCRYRNIAFFSSMTTNGYFLEENIFKQMLDDKISLFMITIDGFEEIHNQNRCLTNGEGTFKRIISNLRQIRDNIKTSHFRIRIRINVTRELLPRLKDFIEFLYVEFGEDKRFNFIFVAASDYGGESIKKIGNSLMHSFDEVYDTLIESPYRLDYTGFAGQLNANLCYAGKRNAYIIKPNGLISKCTVLDEDTAIIGSLDKSGRMELDKSKLARWIIRKMDEESRCMSCIRKSECNRACPLIYNFKETIDCTCDCINEEKIVQLITMDDCKRYNQVIEI